MNFEKILPPPDLRQYVRHIGVLEDDGGGLNPQKFKIIVDGCPGLIFQENPASFRYKGGQLPALFLHGLATQCAEKLTAGPFHNLCVYFQPHALKSVFGLDAQELNNSYTDLSNLIKNDLAEKLRYAANTAQRIQLLSAFIRTQISKQEKRMPATLEIALSKMQDRATEYSLGQVRNHVDLSERSLERLFKTHVGVSPKFYLRIIRFQQALTAIRNGHFDSLTSLAYQYAYNDQSHHIREFRAFAGCTPRQFLLGANEQARNFPAWQTL